MNTSMYFDRVWRKPQKIAAIDESVMPEVEGIASG